MEKNTLKKTETDGQKIEVEKKMQCMELGECLVKNIPMR